MVNVWAFSKPPSLLGTDVSSFRWILMCVCGFFSPIVFGVVPSKINLRSKACLCEISHSAYEHVLDHCRQSLLQQWITQQTNHVGGEQSRLCSKSLCLVLYLHVLICLKDTLTAKKKYSETLLIVQSYHAGVSVNIWSTKLRQYKFKNSMETKTRDPCHFIVFAHCNPLVHWLWTADPNRAKPVLWSRIQKAHAVKENMAGTIKTRCSLVNAGNMAMNWDWSHKRLSIRQHTELLSL